MTSIEAVKGLIVKSVLGLALVAVPAAWAASGSTPAQQRIGLERTGAGTFSIDVQGADVRTVCRAIAEFSGRNIVVAGGVKGEITITLHNVGWEEALHTLLRMSGLDFIDEGGILRVDDMGKLRAEQLDRESAISKSQEVAPLETRIIKLNYANAVELTAPLQGALTKRGSIQVERRTNSVIVTDLPANLERVEKMALELDSTTPEIEITAKLVDVDVEALNSIGIQWKLGSADQPDLGSNGTGDFPNDIHNAPLNPGNDGNSELGTAVTEGLAENSFKLHYGLLKSWGSLEAQLQMLAQNRKANIISNPRITTVDNREAKIVVGQKIPLIVQDVAGNPVSQLQTVGIQLKVTPHLTSDKKVIMDLHPEVSDLATQSTVQGGVIINTSEADTRVMVEDGQTAVIGGLIRTNESTVHRGVPYLKDIPGLGYLFRSTNVVRQNRELIIFVTPRIVTNMASN